MEERDYRTDPMTDEEAMLLRHQVPGKLTFSDKPNYGQSANVWKPPESWRLHVPPTPNWKWDFFGDGHSWIIQAHFPKLTRWQRWSAWWWFGSKFTRLK